MKPHPFVVATVLMLVGVMAWSASLVIRHREARRRRPPPILDEPAPAPPPRPRPVSFVAPPPRAASPPRPAAPLPATLRLQVAGPHGLRVASVEATAVRQGDPDQAETAFEPPPEDGDDDAPSGLLLASDLTPGRYDVAVAAPGMRHARVTGVPTDGKTLLIALDRVPVLRGAFGSGADEDGACAGASVRVEGPPADEGDGEQTTVDADVNEVDCTFALDQLPASGPLTVIGRRAGRIERALVTVPDTGDPAFVCLGGPCGAAPASVAVYVVDARGAQVDAATLDWTLVGDDLRGELGMVTGAGFTYLDHRRPGETLRLRAFASSQETESTVSVGWGVTDVVLTLPGLTRPRRRSP